MDIQQEMTRGRWTARLTEAQASIRKLSVLLSEKGVLY